MRICNIMFLKELRLLFLFFLISACATTYRVSDLREHTSVMDSIVKKTMKDIEKDYSNKKYILFGLKNNGADFLKFPFNSLEEKFNKISKLKIELEAHRKQVNVQYMLFKNIENEKNEITKKDPEYLKVQEYKAFAEKFKENVEPKFFEYSKYSNEFTSIANKSEIYVLDISRVKRKINKMEKKIRKNIKTNSAKLIKARKELGKDEVNLEKKRMLDEMFGIINQIKSESQLVQKAGQELQRIIKVKGKVVVGPHMKSHGFIINIKEHGENIHAMVKRFNSLNQKISQ